MVEANSFINKDSDKEILGPIEVRKLGIVQSDKMPNYFGNRSFARMIQFSAPKKRTRLVVKKGLENIAMLLTNIALFYSENKIVYAIDQHGKKYITENNLSELEHELDESSFFRANRQYIININHLKSFRTYERVKLKVDMNPGVLHEECHIVISQETAPAFKKWIYSA